MTHTATLVDNSATQALVTRLQSAPVTVTLNSSGGFEQVPSDKVQCTKELRDGQVVVVRGGKTYTLQGQEVK